MRVVVCDSKEELGRRASDAGALLVRDATEARGRANIILATGASQFEMLAQLAAAEGIDWSKVTIFHLDEYLDMPATHPASFRKYLKERFVDRLPHAPQAFHAIDGQADPAVECERLGRLIAVDPIDVALIGIGENGHLAFNDPPADFTVESAYLTVRLDEACRQQQFGEGWFPTLADVPKQAISMSIRQIMRSVAIICSVPDTRKATAVQAAIEGPITAELPASILQNHPAAVIYLDPQSASQLTTRKDLS